MTAVASGKKGRDFYAMLGVEKTANQVKQKDKFSMKHLMKFYKL